MREHEGGGATPFFPLVDTHAHLDDEAFDADRDQVLNRARAAGVSAIINVGYAEARWSSTLALARDQPDVYAVLGVHPRDAASWSPALQDRLALALRLPGVVGVGEIGLDFHRPGGDRDAQRAAFSAQVDLARTLDLPIVVHSRDAEAEVVAMLRQMAPLRGVLHSFSGSDATARQALEHGLCLSLTGPVSYPSGQRQRDLAGLIPRERLLLETDAPYLAPQPRRGRRNEPAFLRYTAESLALTRGEPLDRLCRETSANARRLFDLRPVAPLGKGGTRHA